MVQIEIRCPACSKRGKIELEESVINQSSRGVTAINIDKEQICSHSFVAYVDKNMDVRDCFLTDFQIELPTIESNKIEETEIPSKDTADVDLIKLNIHALQLAFILRSMLFKKSTVIVSDKDFLFDHLRNFFNFVFNGSFNFNLYLLSKEEYRKDKRNYKKSIVLERSEVLVDKTKLLDPKKIMIERTIVQKFFGEYSPRSSLIILKNEIHKAFELAKKIIKLIENHEGKEKIGKKKLIDKLSEQEKLKVSFSYLEFLLDIIKNYFDFDLSVLSDYYFPAFGI